MGTEPLPGWSPVCSQATSLKCFLPRNLPMAIALSGAPGAHPVTKAATLTLIPGTVMVTTLWAEPGPRVSCTPQHTASWWLCYVYRVWPSKSKDVTCVWSFREQRVPVHPPPLSSQYSCEEGVAGVATTLIWHGRKLGPRAGRGPGREVLAKSKLMAGPRTLAPVWSFPWLNLGFPISLRWAPWPPQP